MTESETANSMRDIAFRLRDTAFHMRTIAKAMEAHEAAPWRKHAKELVGASEIAMEWATEIEDLLKP